MTNTKRNKSMFTAPGAVLIGLLTSGAINAQQPLVAKAAHPALAMFAQVDPGQPEPPQGNGAPLKDDLFAGTEKFAKGASDITEVTMDPDSLSLVGGDDAKRAHRTVLSVVRTYSYDKPGMYNMADVEEYRRKLESGDWHCSIHTRDLKSGESTDICSRRRPPDMVENAIITVEPKELTFIHNIKHMNGQGGGLDMGFPGAELLLGIPPNVTMALAEPEMKAQMAIAQAEMKANSAQWAQDMAQLKIEMPSLDSKAMGDQIRRSQQEMRRAQRTMRQFQGTPQPSSPDISERPEAPEAAEAPEHPEAPEATPAVPQAPAAPQTPPAPQF